MTEPAAPSALARAVRAAARRALRAPDRFVRTRNLTELLAELQEQVVAVTAERDAQLVELLAEQPARSHRRLAADLALSRQRIDQLAAHARAGGRPRSPWDE